MYHIQNPKTKWQIVQSKHEMANHNHHIWIYAVCKFNYFHFSASSSANRRILPMGQKLFIKLRSILRFTKVQKKHQQKIRFACF